MMLLGFIGHQELIIILVIALLIFGATSIPKIARSLGKSSSEFKKGVREGAKGDDEEKEDEKPSEQG